MRLERGKKQKDKEEGHAKKRETERDKERGVTERERDLKMIYLLIKEEVCKGIDRQKDRNKRRDRWKLWENKVFN